MFCGLVFWCLCLDFQTGDVVGIHVNLHAGTVIFECNGQLIKQCNDVTPAARAGLSEHEAETGGLEGGSAPLYFAVAIQSNGNNSGNNVVTVTTLLEEDGMFETDAEDDAT